MKEKPIFIEQEMRGYSNEDIEKLEAEGNMPEGDMLQLNPEQYKQTVNDIVKLCGKDKLTIEENVKLNLLSLIGFGLSGDKMKEMLAMAEQEITIIAGVSFSLIVIFYSIFGKF